MIRFSNNKEKNDRRRKGATINSLQNALNKETPRLSGALSTARYLARMKGQGPATILKNIFFSSRYNYVTNFEFILRFARCVI